MSRQLNPSQVWSQVPVANRLIEVNTKTGFSLTAGSYSVRASSTQRSTISQPGGTTDTNSTISSVTTTRAYENENSQSGSSGISGDISYIRLTSATNVAATRTQSSAAYTVAYVVMELF